MDLSIRKVTREKDAYNKNHGIYVKSSNLIKEGILQKNSFYAVIKTDKFKNFSSSNFIKICIISSFIPKKKTNVSEAI